MPDLWNRIHAYQVARLNEGRIPTTPGPGSKCCPSTSRRVTAQQICLYQLENMQAPVKSACVIGLSQKHLWADYEYRQFHQVLGDSWNHDPGTDVRQLAAALCPHRPVSSTKRLKSDWRAILSQSSLRSWECGLNGRSGRASDRSCGLHRL
ncbi:hypothetical protein ASPBRDRAFT_580591 [Aspergillus brasiliensis CBS 101740]|uniref:Uncharacterized protein n=1 Tax=Aspergillus brasiliensis (strain CBS 101740 / IMI 381727 / IBT 21946) TaxID=767769 RepID=A0A1L9UJV1_ASPBC|nr:hypothetical protein ASPBRDRAFT_580591 [Aspergillus brasiliensis CBS 101740]